jgi:hypothetical protein
MGYIVKDLLVNFLPSGKEGADVVEHLPWWLASDRDTSWVANSCWCFGQSKEKRSLEMTRYLGTLEAHLKKALDETESEAKKREQEYRPHTLQQVEELQKRFDEAQAWLRHEAAKLKKQ